MRRAALVLVALLAGCAAPQTSMLLERGPEGLPPHAELSSVPFYPQEAHQCGPAALATALGAEGLEISPDALTPEVYLPGREGSLAEEMIAATRRHAFIAYRLAPNLENVLREVASGTPVVVLQNLSLPIMPQWHFAVVVGYDLPREQLVLRSGVTRHYVMTMSNFERTWARSGYWAMVALPPDRLPATATADGYVSAAIALERTNVAAARKAYATALSRWPDNVVAELGLGNAAYAMGDLAAAEHAYRSATRAHPESGDAWNNLAQVLADTKRPEEARAAAQRAVALGGPRLAQYQETLRALAGDPPHPVR